MNAVAFCAGDASQISRSIIKSGDQHESAKPISPITGFSRDGGGQRSATSSSDVKLNANTDPNEASDECYPNLSTDGLGPKIADRPTQHCGDDTVVVKFVGSAIVGKSEAEDACHHGLVDPTVNMMEAMNAISSMFREPLELEPAAIRRSKPKENPKSNVLEVFVDECLVDEKQTETKLMNTNSPRKQTETEPQKPLVGAFKIWTEEEDDDENDDLELNEHLQLPKPVYSSLNSSCSAETDVTSSEDFRVNGDTVIRRFVGSTVFDDPEVENACHHGLVDPTVNLKEAMDDINSMFGKPLNFVRAKRPTKQAKPIEHASASQGFCILADDDLGDDSCGQASQANPSKFGRENDLFEPTVFTKEAMADINELFGKPLDF